MKRSDSHILNSYWGLIRTLHLNWKLDLIERLTQSIRQNLKQNPNTMKSAFGAWKSDLSAEQIIKMLRSSRKNDRQIEAL